MKKLFRKIFIYLPLFLILIIGFLYFIITSGFFLKFVGLPLAGTFIGMPIKAEKISVSFLINPHLDVNGLIFGYPEKPFITGEKISTRFNLLSLLKGDLQLANVALDGIDINMVSGKDGKWNVNWMNEPSSLNTKRGSSENTKTTSSTTMQLDIAGVSIRNVNFILNAGDEIKVVLKNFNIYSDSFKNLQESSVKIKGNIEQFAGKNVTINNGKVDTILKTNLNEEYFPTSLQLDSIVSDFTGIIKGRAISNRSFKVNALLNPENNNVVNVSNISVKEYTGNTPYSSLVIKGRVALVPFSFDLNIKADPIGSDTINLVTNPLLHTDMGNDASLAFKGDVSLANNLFTAKGDLQLTDLLLQSPISSKRKELVSAAFKYNIATDFSTKKTDIEQFQVAVNRESTPIISMSLKKPASIVWSNDQIKVKGEVPEIIGKISDMKLSVFNKFLPSSTEFSSGTLNSDLNLKIGANGTDVSLTGNINLSDASYVSSCYNIKEVNLNQDVDFALCNKKYLIIKNCIDLTQNGQKLLKSSFIGKYDLNSGDGELNTSVPYYNPATINVLPDTILPKQEKNQLISKLSPFSFIINNKQAFNVRDGIITVKDILFELQTEKKGTISLSQNRSLKLNPNGKQLITEPLSFKVNASDFELENLNSFFAPTAEFQKGVINFTANTVIEKDFKTISASGVVTGSDINGNVNGNKLSNTGINTNFNVTCNSQAGACTLTDTIVKLFYGNNDSANLSVNGILRKEGTTNFETKFRVNENLLKALNKTGSDYKKIEAFLLYGSLKLGTTKDTFSVSGNVNIPKLTIVDKQSAQTERINGVLDISLYKNSQCLNINSAKLNLYSNKLNICDLASRGKIVFSDNAQSNLDVSSEKVDLKKILHICDLLFPSTQESIEAKNNAAGHAQAKEPAPIDLRGINLKGNINFNDIEYGSFIHMIISSNLMIEDNIISLMPFIVRMNQGELKANIHVNPSFIDGYTYEVKSKLQNLDINPLLKTFIKGDFNGTKGTISSLQFNAIGKGVTSPNLLNNLNGNIVAVCNNMSLPLEISQNKFLALFLMPIQIISNINQKVPNTPFPSDFNQAMDLAVNIMAQHNNITLHTGDIALRMNNGIVNIEKFYFAGGDNDMIKTMKFEGKIGPDNKLNLKTNIDFGKLNIPLNFYGTVENPNLDIPAFIAGFITKNAVHFLDVTQKIFNSTSTPQRKVEPAQQSGNVSLEKIPNASPMPKGKEEESSQQLESLIFDVPKGILDTFL